MPRLLIAAALMVVAFHVVAAPRAEFPGGHITLTKEPCALEQVLSAVPPEYKKKMFKAKVKYKGKDIEACWTVYNGQVQGADEYMNVFAFDREDFKEATEI